MKYVLYTYIIRIDNRGLWHSAWNINAWNNFFIFIRLGISNSLFEYVIEQNEMGMSNNKTKGTLVHECEQYFEH